MAGEAQEDKIRNHIDLYSSTALYIILERIYKGNSHVTFMNLPMKAQRYTPGPPCMKEFTQGKRDNAPQISARSRG